MIPHYFHHAKIVSVELGVEPEQLPAVPLSSVLAARFTATRRWYIGQTNEGPWFPVPADTAIEILVEGITGWWFKADGPCELSVLAMGT